MSTPLLVTAGEPAGIAPEIIGAAWQHYRQSDVRFAVVGDADFIQNRGNVETQTITSFAEASTVFSDCLPVWNCPLRVPVAAGVPHKDNAPFVIEAIDIAVSACHKHEVRGLVTAPIDKSVLRQAGFPHQGHTDYLCFLDEQFHGVRKTAVMMLAAKNFRCVPVTIHLALEDAIKQVNAEEIHRTLQTLCDALVRDYGIEKPSIAVGALNPHAGESGQMGSHEAEIINPALEQFRALRRDVSITDALPTDSMFTAPMRKKYDAFLAMTHDQALIPIKTLFFEQAVNTTLGLSFIRTSPDHGTAYDLAGTHTADPRSMIAAIAEAWRVSAKIS